jgi:hypothetical protein
MLLKPVELTKTYDPRIGYKGFCSSCGRDHGLVIGYARDHAIALLKDLDEAGRIDFDVPESEADPRFSTDYLYGPAKGQMFGVLVCRDKAGSVGVLKAFSGQYNSVWRVPGWVPPLVDVDALDRVRPGVERMIKNIGLQIDELSKDSPFRKTLVDKRKAISQAFMKDIHAMYRLQNFRREVSSLPDVVYGDGGISAGTGDCCAPKLLGYAARKGLTPLGLTEFYFGSENLSGTKKHGKVYTSCSNKCGRILGYMLCGLDDK